MCTGRDEKAFGLRIRTFFWGVLFASSPRGFIFSLRSWTAIAQSSGSSTVHSCETNRPGISVSRAMPKHTGNTSQSSTALAASSTKVPNGGMVVLCAEILHAHGVDSHHDLIFEGRGPVNMQRLQRKPPSSPRLGASNAYPHRSFLSVGGVSSSRTPAAACHPCHHSHDRFNILSVHRLFSISTCSILGFKVPFEWFSQITLQSGSFVYFFVES